MADPSAVARLRANLDDGGAAQAFLDDELAALLDAAGGDLLLAERDAWWQLHAGAVKEVDHTIGEAREQASQRAEQIGDRLDRLERRLAGRAAGAGAGHTLGTTSAPVRAGW